MEEKREDNTVIILRIDGITTIEQDDIWFDNDSPKDPTIDDVIAGIKKHSKSAKEFFENMCAEDFCEFFIERGNKSKKINF
jgi:hypothetical protein